MASVSPPLINTSGKANQLTTIVVDILAPGTNITSAWIDVPGGKSLNKTRTIQGTSMGKPPHPRPPPITYRL